MHSLGKYAEKLISFRPVKFLIAGGLAAAVEYLSFVLVIVWLGLTGVISGQVISYLLGFIVSFYLQRSWVFRSKGAVKGELLKYTLLAGINLALGLIMIWLLVNPLNVHPLLAKVVVMAAVACWNYFIFGKIIFSHATKKQKIYLWQGVAGIFLIASTVTAVFTPPMLGIDEHYHYNRAYQVSQGGVISDTHNGKIGGAVPQSVLQYEAKVIEAKYDKSGERVDWGVLSKEAFMTPLNSPEVMANYPGAAAYNPLPYLPAALAIALTTDLETSIGVSVVLARVFTVFICVAVLTMALYLLKGRKVIFILATVALWPTFIFQTGTVGADALQNSLSILLLAAVYRSLSDKRVGRLSLISLVISAISIPLVKFTFLPLSFLVLLIPPSYFPRLRSYGEKTGIIIVIIAIFLTCLWIFMVRDFASSNGQQVPYVDGVGITTPEKIEYALDHPIQTILLIPKTLIESGIGGAHDYPSQVVGTVGFNSVSLPDYVVIMGWLLLGLAILYARSEIRLVLAGKRRWVVALAVALSIILIFATLYVSWTRAGSPVVHGVQGRYFLPLVPWVFMIVSTLIPIKITATRRVVVCSIVGLGVISILVYFFYYFGTTFDMLHVTPR